jgi:hypothetical protein
MPLVTLKFKSANLLWQFKQAIKAGNVNIDLKKCTLTCNCSAEEIKLAMEKYGAIIIEEEQRN